MSHGDLVEEVAPGFEIIGGSDSCPAGAVRHRERRLYGVQFHPEVTTLPGAR